MAKLEGVKVIDMTDGEIEKISYDGEEYVRVDGEGKKGDIALVVSAWGSQNVGEYYPVISEDHRSYTEEGSKEYVYIKGKTCDANCFRHRVELFRPVSELNKLVYDGVEYRKVTGRDAAFRGDYIVFTNEDDKPVFTTVGKPYKIISFDWMNDPVFYDDNGGTRQPDRYTYSSEIYEKVTQSDDIITFEERQYKRVYREAREGDVVVFTGDTPSYITNGKSYAVTEVCRFIDNDGDVLDVYSEIFGRTPETTKVYALIDDFKTKKDESQAKGVVATVVFNDGKVEVLENVKYINIKEAE
jgi:hypothetical protein